MDQPFLLMVAGPNGSGKTTLTQLLRRRGVDLGEYINPDDIAREISGSGDERTAEAQVMADRRREACIGVRQSFSFETVMSHPSKIDILDRARGAGYFVVLYFVGTDDPRTNIERVALRVAQGGHDVPKDKIESRWWRTMGHLADAIKSSNRAFVFDNSTAGMLDLGPRLVLCTTLGQELPTLDVQQSHPLPDWVRRFVLKPLRID